MPEPIEWEVYYVRRFQTKQESGMPELPDGWYWDLREAKGFKGLFWSQRYRLYLVGPSGKDWGYSNVPGNHIKEVVLSADILLHEIMVANPNTVNYVPTGRIE